MMKAWMGCAVRKVNFVDILDFVNFLDLHKSFVGTTRDRFVEIDKWHKRWHACRQLRLISGEILRVGDLKNRFLCVFSSFKGIRV